MLPDSPADERILQALKKTETQSSHGQLGSKHIKDSKERLFIMTLTHSQQIFGVIPFVKLQNDT